MKQFNKKPITLGLEKALADKKVFGQGRVGLICNQASVDHGFRHAADLFYEDSDIKLTTLFGPQHGIRGDVQDNMVETSHTVDEVTGLPIYSLYSETREPTPEMLSSLDVLAFDLQDVGCRVYTFIYTMANAMRACAVNGKKMVILDRPNPIGGTAVEGNVLEKGHESFVGMYPIPMRHGMTVGELALLFNTEFDINCELEVIKMDGWAREDYYDQTDAPWVMPSPNMPTVDTAVVFPGTVFFEGTQISEGRGTTRPFEIVGAPYVSAVEYTHLMNALNLPGVIFRSIGFKPTFQKYSQEVCGGTFLHVTDRREFEPVITGIAMVQTLFDLYPHDFKWKESAYEYVFDRNPFDVIAGTSGLREQLENKIGLDEIRKQWQIENDEFKRIREKYLLY